MNLDLVSMPFIVSAVYFVIYCLKLWVLKTDESRKNIPVIAGALGILIAMVCYFAAPELLNVSTITDAFLTGLGSGLSAVGINQIKKQYTSTDTAA